MTNKSHSNPAIMRTKKTNLFFPTQAQRPTGKVMKVTENPKAKNKSLKSLEIVSQVFSKTTRLIEVTSRQMNRMTLSKWKATRLQ